VKKKGNLESIDSRPDARQLETLRVFHEVARALTSSLDLDTLLRSIMAKMENYFGPEQWSLLMLDEESHDLYYALCAHELPPRSVRVAMGEGIAGWVASTGRPLVVGDVARDPDWSAYAAAHPELNLQSIACLPIRHGERTLGVLQLLNSRMALLPDSSISFLRVLCDYAAIALENARQVKLIHNLSITDDITGLFNARHLYDLLEQEIRSGTSGRVVSIQPTPFSLVFLDLDHFKSINDTHGHLVGTRLLAEVGGLIKRILGPKHAGVRYGGDEFVALLRGLDKPAALALTEHLRNELNDARFLTATGLALEMHASFGLATFPHDGADMHAIIRSADTMMYVAKADGRNRIAVADPTKPPTLPTPKVSRHT
jgi:diguanylate cyclase (GGDEF)-like protein